jgi:anti-anti-sigma factor
VVEAVIVGDSVPDGPLLPAAHAGVGRGTARTNENALRRIGPAGRAYLPVRGPGQNGAGGPRPVVGEEADVRPHLEIPVPLPGSIAIEDEGDRRVLLLRGELDGAVVASFKAVQRAEPVVVDEIDAAAVTFISSTGVAVMLLAVEASLAAGRSPVLRASSHVVDRLLRMSGIDGLFRRPDDTRD